MVSTSTAEYNDNDLLKEGLAVIQSLLENFASAHINHIVRLQTALEDVLSRRIKRFMRKASPLHALGVSSAQTESPVHAHEGEGAGHRSIPSITLEHVISAMGDSASCATRSAPPFTRNQSSSEELPSRISVGLTKMNMAKDYHSSTKARKLHRQRVWWDSVSIKSRCSTWTHNSCEGRLTHLLESAAFECAVSLLILLNGILIGIVADSDLRCAVTGTLCSVWASNFTAGLNTGLTIAFALELVVRMFASGLKLWCQSGWQLNVLDCVVVLTSLIEEAARSGWFADLLHVRVLRCLRLMRTIRVVQTFSVFHTLRALLNAIKDSVICFF